MSNGTLGISRGILAIGIRAVNWRLGGLPLHRGVKAPTHNFKQAKIRDSPVAPPHPRHSRQSGEAPRDLGRTA